MSENIIFRIISFQGFGRIEVKKTGTLKDLKDEISKAISVNTNELKLFTDVQQQKQISFSDSTSVLKLGLKEGDAIHIGNKEPSKPQQTLTNQPNNKSSVVNNNNVNDKSKNTTDKKDEADKTKEVDNLQKLISSSWHKKEEKEVKSELDKQKEKMGMTLKCNHPSTSKCLNCMPTPNYKGNIKFNCLHGPTGKCPNCVTKDIIEDVKHLSFDEYLAKRQAKCKGTHDPNSKCNNCVPPLEQSYKFNRNCNKHAPYPEGLCGKCIPPAVTLGSQHYRHVDYVSFMNFEEINLFVQQWQKDHCLKQRMAYLFGYFAEDPNYPNGIRAVVEAIYEPKQIGDHDSVQPLEDKNDFIVDAISGALTLEFIGWMFTTINTNKDVLMCSYDIKKAAIYQEQYKVKHTSGNWVSKFITVMVKPKEDGNVVVECSMVSDSFQALVRDGIIGECVDKAVIPIRKPEKNEVLPDIFQESKKVDSFDPAFAIVSISHGAPVDKKGFNILKSYDFPIESRMEKNILTENHIKEYFKKKKKETPMNKYANFNFLIYLAKVLDLATAENFARQIYEEKLDGEIIDGLMESVIGYN